MTLLFLKLSQKIFLKLSQTFCQKLSQKLSLKLSQKLTLKKGILVAKGGALKKPQHFGYILALWPYLKLQDGPWVRDSQCKHLLAPYWVVVCSCLIWRNFQHVWEHPHGIVQLEWLFWQLNPSGQPCRWKKEIFKFSCRFQNPNHFFQFEL